MARIGLLTSTAAQEGRTSAAICTCKHSRESHAFVLSSFWLLPYSGTTMGATALAITKTLPPINFLDCGVLFLELNSDGEFLHNILNFEYSDRNRSNVFLRLATSCQKCGNVVLNFVFSKSSYGQAAGFWDGLSDRSRLLTMGTADHHISLRRNPFSDSGGEVRKKLFPDLLSHICLVNSDQM